MQCWQDMTGSKSKNGRKRDHITKGPTKGPYYFLTHYFRILFFLIIWYLGTIARGAVTDSELVSDLLMLAAWLLLLVLGGKRRRRSTTIRVVLLLLLSLVYI